MVTAVETTFNYSFPAQEAQYPGTAGHHLRERDVVHTTVSDARGKEASFSLDRNGFEFHTFVSEKEFSDDKEQFKAAHYPQIVVFLKKK